jgi:hypothetical protein
MARMDTYDELNGDDEPVAESMDGVPAYRKRAAELLDDIARRTNQSLADAGIEMDVFFMIPSSGHSVLSFGTPADPSDAVWDQVTEIVSLVVRQSVGLEHFHGDWK